MTEHSLLERDDQEADLASVRRVEREPVSASVFAKDLRTGETLAAINPTIPLLPGSNAKLVTAARSFAELGPAYRFETTVHAVGERQDGHLLGDLVITGGGAPDLSQADLMALADQVAAAGIETVVGELVVDASAFDSQSLGPGWTWDDGQFHYGAKSTPLAIERNTVDITIASRDGSVHVDASPTSEIVRLDIDVDVGPEWTLEVYKKRASEVICVEGDIPPDELVTKASPVDDPMMHAASLFKDALEAKGITVDGWTRIEDGPAETAGTPCAVVQSAPLSTIVSEMLVDSDNFAAEQLARTIALERDGVGSWDGWNRHVSDFLANHSCDAVRLRDGSGLSRYNLLSAACLVSVLEWCLEQPWATQYCRSLALAGEDGTVSDRLTDVSVPIRAKTGTLTGARALSGYIDAEDGNPAAVFSCLLSNLTSEYEATATDRIDDLVREIVAAADLD